MKKQQGYIKMFNLFKKKKKEKTHFDKLKDEIRDESLYQKVLDTESEDYIADFVKTQDKEFKNIFTSHYFANITLYFEGERSCIVNNALENTIDEIKKDYQQEFRKGKDFIRSDIILNKDENFRQDFFKNYCNTKSNYDKLERMNCAYEKTLSDYK